MTSFSELIAVETHYQEDDEDEKTDFWIFLELLRVQRMGKVEEDRLNKEPPNLTFRKKDKGGINFTSTVANTHLDLDTVKAICSEYRIHNADITLRFDATADDLIDVIEGSRIYMPCIYVVNKIDQITLEELEILDKLPHYCPISAHLEWNLDGLLEKIWEYLDLTRIYTKPKGMNPDYEDPVILSSKKRTVEDFCERIHKDMLKQFKYALVWGSSAKHKPQRVGKVGNILVLSVFLSIQEL
ncbi:hypothetical protein TIFTF001_004163 [Ficus carica]|uniref:TGS domain-containing protein n=1 Tax=Ficus carica TaxID=3494 RepID=A0AA87ZAP5_FICCA|nr:hypothetical protein TIFTF001_004163 [Ficus carica]